MDLLLDVLSSNVIAVVSPDTAVYPTPVKLSSIWNIGLQLTYQHFGSWRSRVSYSLLAQGEGLNKLGHLRITRTGNKD